MSAISVGNLLTVHRLQRRAMPLCPDAGLTQWPPLWTALTAALTAESAAVVTCVAAQPSVHADSLGFVQVRPLPNRQSAEMLYIAPAPADDEAPAVWDALLSRVAHWAVSQGVARVLAAVPADGPAPAAFQRNGYMRYASDTVYERPFPGAGGEPALNLRPRQPEDSWGLQQLHVAATPVRVQQAEGLASPDSGADAAPLGRTADLVLDDAAGIVAYLQLRRGGAAHWIRLEVRPDADSLAVPLVQEALARMALWPARPIRACARQYQGLIPAALVECGFTPTVDRALIVRHSVLPVRPVLDEAVQRLPGSLGKSLKPTLPEPCNSADGSRLSSTGDRSAQEWRYDRSKNH